MKTITTPASGVQLSPKPSSKGLTTLCHNLRQTLSPTGIPQLTPVGQLSVLASGSWRPLAMMQPALGVNLLIVASGLTLGYIDLTPKPDPLSSADSAPIEIAVMRSEIRCAVTDGSRLTVMTATGAYTADYDVVSAAWSHADISEFPVLSLIAEPLSDAESTVAPRRLSCEYSAGMNFITSLDMRNISADLARAYRDVCAQAAASGSFCAPAFCRYRLIGHHGETLYDSPAVLLGAPDSTRQTASLTLHSADRRNLEAYTLSAPRWRLRVASSKPVAKRVADYVSRIEILATPQFHPFDPAGLASLTVVPPSAKTDFARVTLQGASKAISSDNSLPAATRLRRAVSALPSLEKVVAVIHAPFGSSSIDLKPQIDAVSANVDDDCRLIERAMTAEVSPVDPTEARLGPPHEFSATCCSSASGFDLWGDLTALRFDGYPAEAFAASLAAEGAWHAAVTVSFSNGDERVVALSQGLSGAPLTFSPVISYPSADAVSMTITVSAGGEVRRSVLPLTPDPSGRHALYVSPSMQSFSLSDTLSSFVQPLAVSVPLRLPSYVALASKRSPSHLLAVDSLGDCFVMALRPCCRSQSAWDYNRIRFSAFTSSGIYTVNSSRNRSGVISSLLVDNAVLASPAAVTEVGGRLIAVASTRLVEVGPTRVRTLADGIDAASLAYSPSFRELWASDGSETKVINLDDNTFATRTEAFDCEAVGSYVLVGGSLVDLSIESPRESTYIRWVTAVDLPLGYTRFVRASVDMKGAWQSEGEFAVHRLNGATAEPSPSMSVRISGELRSPFVRQVAALPARRLGLSVQGRVSPSTLFSSTSIDF